MDDDGDPFDDEEETETAPNYDETREEKGDEASEAAVKEPVVRRIVKNPQPKLNPERLYGPKGIPELLRMSKDLKFKGKGHELHDVSLIVNTLKHWGHRLFPKVTSDNFFERVEKLGMKRPVQGYVRRLRMGLEHVDVPIKSKDGDTVDDDNVLRGAAEHVHQPQDDPFESLLDQSVDNALPSSSGAAQPYQVEAITQSDEEVRARVERNRQLAIERRLKRLAERNNLVTQNDSSVPDDSEAAAGRCTASTSRNSSEVLTARESSPSQFTSANAGVNEEADQDGNQNSDTPFLGTLEGDEEEAQISESVAVNGSLPGGTRSGAVKNGIAVPTANATSPVPDGCSLPLQFDSDDTELRNIGSGTDQDLAPSSICNGQSEAVLDSEGASDFTALRTTHGSADTLTANLDVMMLRDSWTGSRDVSSLQYDSENANIDGEIVKDVICLHQSKSEEACQDGNTVTMNTAETNETVSMATCSSGGITEVTYNASESIFDSPVPMDTE